MAKPSMTAIELFDKVVAEEHTDLLQEAVRRAGLSPLSGALGCLGACTPFRGFVHSVVEIGAA